MNEIENTLTLLHSWFQPGLSTMVHSEDGGEMSEYSLKHVLTWLLQYTSTNTVNVMLKWITHKSGKKSSYNRNRYIYRESVGKGNLEWV